MRLAAFLLGITLVYAMPAATAAPVAVHDDAEGDLVAFSVYGNSTIRHKCFGELGCIKGFAISVFSDANSTERCSEASPDHGCLLVLGSISGTGDAYGNSNVVISGTGSASSCCGLAASGTGPAEADFLAVSGTESANGGKNAISIFGDAETGTNRCTLIALGTCFGTYAVSVFGHATGTNEISVCDTATSHSDDRLCFSDAQSLVNLLP